MVLTKAAFRAVEEEASNSGMSSDEYAFDEALADSESAQLETADEKPPVTLPPNS